MNEKETRLKTVIKDIEFKMIRKNSKCWIKIAPLNPVSVPTILHFYLNDEYYTWDIYDQDGKEKHIIYFEGLDCKPFFYLNSGKYNVKVKCDEKSIKVITNDKPYNLELLKKKCNCISSKSSCWAKNVYYTSRPDKPPFDEM